MINDKNTLYRMCRDYLEDNNMSKLYLKTFLEIAESMITSYDEIYFNFKKVVEQAKKINLMSIKLDIDWD